MIIYSLIYTIILGLRNTTISARKILPKRRSGGNKNAFKNTIKTSQPRQFNIDNSLEMRLKSYGPVIDVDYSIYSGKLKNLDLKVWVQVNLNRKDPQKAMLTVVRLDNIDENPGEHLEYLGKTKICDNRLWREYRGWPTPLLLHIIGLNNIGIPENHDFDTLQMELLNVDFSLLKSKSDFGCDYNGSGVDGSTNTAIAIAASTPATTAKTSIPRIIHQVGPDHKGELAMKVVEKAMLITRLKNQCWEQRVVAADEMGDIIEQLEGPTVKQAFDDLIPIAYRADLYRYVALYHYGGVYMDSKLVPRKKYDSIITEGGGRAFITRDAIDPDLGLQIAFMGMEKGDPLMRSAIDKVVENVKNRFYGNGVLSITGPSMMAALYSKIEDRKNRYSVSLLMNMGRIVDQNTNVINYHNGEYRRMQRLSKNARYGWLWKIRRVYKLRDDELETDGSIEEDGDSGEIGEIVDNDSDEDNDDSNESMSQIEDNVVTTLSPSTSSSSSFIVEEENKKKKTIFKIIK